LDEHHHLPSSARNLGVALSITATFFVIELAGGILANSLALQTDAWHMLSDAFALVFALIASLLAMRPITNRKTYGYYRSEIIAAFLQGILLWGIVVFIFYEAFERIQHPQQVNTLEMLIIAVLGLVANGLSALTLSGLKEQSLNVKGAFLHVLGDALGSIGVISAGIVMFLTGWYQIDPLISIAIGVFILFNSGSIIRDALNVLLEGVPPNIDITVLERRLGEVNGVESIHDLHVWCMTPTRMCILSCHIVVKKGTNKKKLNTTLIKMLKEEFGVDHTTIQLEDEGYTKAIGEH